MFQAFTCIEKYGISLEQPKSLIQSLNIIY